jgi:hypothetical protein
MFQLEDLRKTRVWRQAREEGKTLAKTEEARRLSKNGRR